LVLCRFDAFVSLQQWLQRTFESGCSRDGAKSSVTVPRKTHSRKRIGSQACHHPVIRLNCPNADASLFLLWVEIARSGFSGANAQIGSADYRFIKSPLTGVAEMPPHR